MKNYARNLNIVVKKYSKAWGDSYFSNKSNKKISHHTLLTLSPTSPRPNPSHFSSLSLSLSCLNPSPASQPVA